MRIVQLWLYWHILGSTRALVHLPGNETLEPEEYTFVLLRQRRVIMSRRNHAIILSSVAAVSSVLTVPSFRKPVCSHVLARPCLRLLLCLLCFSSAMWGWALGALQLCYCCLLLFICHLVTRRNERLMVTGRTKEMRVGVKLEKLVEAIEDYSPAKDSCIKAFVRLCAELAKSV